MTLIVESFDAPDETWALPGGARMGLSRNRPRRLSGPGEVEIPGISVIAHDKQVK